MGARPGTRHEVEPTPEPRFYVTLQHRGARWPHACVGPMPKRKAEVAAVSWRKSGMCAEVTKLPIGKNLTNEMEGV